MCGLWEVIRSRGGAPVNDISALIKETPEAPSSLLTVRTQ